MMRRIRWVIFLSIFWGLLGSSCGKKLLESPPIEVVKETTSSAETADAPKETAATERSTPPKASATAENLLAAEIEKASVLLSKSEVQVFNLALKNYYLDEGLFPAFGRKPDPERNDFPRLYNALQDRPRSEGGKGGRSAPYLDGIEQERICVRDDENNGYRPATGSERIDNKIDKYVIDLWGNPLIYRCNKGIAPLRLYMRNEDYDIYSLGPNGVDDTAAGAVSSDNDDLGNW